MPQSSVRYSVITPGARSPDAAASSVMRHRARSRETRRFAGQKWRVRFLASAMDRVEACARRLQRPLEHLEYAFRLGRVVRRVVADVDVDRHEPDFGPRMDR